MEVTLVLAQYRRIMDTIHAGGNIFYDKGRLAGYALIAKLASDLRLEALCKTAPN